MGYGLYVITLVTGFLATIALRIDDAPEPGWGLRHLRKAWRQRRGVGPARFRRPRLSRQSSRRTSSLSGKFRRRQF